MRTTLNVIVNNPDLEPADPLSAFLRPSMLAGYNMLDSTDFSGNGRDMLYTGSFNTKGAVLDGDRNHTMVMPVPEANEMTVFICANITTSAAATPQRSILTNLNTTATVYKGFRIAQQPAATDVTAQWANNGTPAVLGFNTPMVGSWLVRAFRWKAAGTSSTAGTVNYLGGTANVGATLDYQRNANASFYFNGVPPGVTSPGVIVEALQGTAGMVLFYGEYMNEADCVKYMKLIAENMSPRGVILPS